MRSTAQRRELKTLRQLAQDLGLLLPQPTARIPRVLGENPAHLALSPSDYLLKGIVSKRCRVHCLQPASV